MKLLVFAFAHTIAAEAAAKMTVPAKQAFIESSQSGVQSFIQQTNFADYTHILGLGAYSGRDQGELRIEQKCSSQFRNNHAIRVELALPHFLEAGEGIKLAAGIGNSWCNLVAYQLLSAQSHCHFSFVHVPKNFEAGTAAHILDTQLRRVQ